MAPPKTPPKTWKELYILGHKLLQLHVGHDSAIAAFFAAYNTDSDSNFVCPYVFMEKTSTTVTQEFDEVIMGTSKLPFSQTIIGMRSDGLKYSPSRPIGINELTGKGGPVANGNFAIVQQRSGNFLNRINIDLDSSRDGQSFRGFMLPYSGSAPKDLVGKLVRGLVAPVGAPIKDMTPWGKAEQMMDEFYGPFAHPNR